MSLAAGADLVGFVFFPASPRHVSFEIAHALGERAGQAQRLRFPSMPATRSLRRASKRSGPTCCNSMAGGAGSRRRGAQALRTPVMKALRIAERADLSRSGCTTRWRII
jgi:phosphoribosylanthranilate isomerase